MSKQIPKITNPADIKKIRQGFVEISGAYTRAAGEKDFIKESVASLAEEFNIPKRVVSKMAKVFYKQNFKEVQEEAEEFAQAYINIDSAH